MAHRATVQQAVELLKIHQIRRENAAIYKQIGHVKNEVLNIKDKQNGLHDQSRKTVNQVNDAKDLVSQQSEQLVKALADISTLLQARVESQMSIDFLRDQIKEQIDRTDSCHDQFSKKLDQVEAHRKQAAQLQQTADAVVLENIKDLRAEVAHKAESTSLDLVQDQLDDLKTRIVMGSQKDCSVDTILVQQSLPKQCCSQDRGRDHDFKNQLRTTRPAKSRLLDTLSDLDCITETASVEGSDLMLTMNPPTINKMSAISEDIDLDENASKTSCVGHTTGQSAPGIMLDVRSHLKAVSDVHDEMLLFPEQDLCEELSSYLERGDQLINVSTEKARKVAVIRIIDGLVDEKQRQLLTEQLVATDYVLGKAQDFTAILEPKLYKEDAPTALIDASFDEPVNAFSVNATDLRSKNEGPQVSGLSDRVPVTARKRQKIDDFVAEENLRLRRSQRLAAKVDIQLVRTVETRKITSSQRDTVVEPKTATTRKLDIMIRRGNGKDHHRHGAMKLMDSKPYSGQTGPQPVTGKSKKTCKKQKNEIKSTKTNKPQQALQSIARPDFDARPERFQGHASNLTILKEVPPTLSKHGLNSYQRLPPTPYDPKPQLVPSKRKASVTARESDSEYLNLPHSLMAGHNTRKTGVGSGESDQPTTPQRAVHRVREVVRRRPIRPPPPEIPILSTTTEGTESSKLGA